LHAIHNNQSVAQVIDGSPNVRAVIKG